MPHGIWEIISASLIKNSSNIAWTRRVRKGDPITYSYDQIYRAALHNAGVLRDKGVGTGDIVGLSAPNGPEWGAAALGILKLGAIVAPIHIANSKEDIRAQVEALEPKCIMVHDFEMEDFGVEKVPISLSDDLASEEQRQPHQVDHHAEAVRIYTSGSTGAAKMVRLSGNNVASNIIGCSKIVQIDGKDKFLSLLPLSHMFEFVGGMLLPLYSGSGIVLPSVLTADEVLTAIKEESVSCVLAVPRLYRNIKKGMEKKFREGPAPLRWYISFLGTVPLSWRKVLNAPVRKKLSSNLRYWVSGGSRLDPSIAQFYRQLGISLRQGYGLTETSPVVCVQEAFPQNFDSVGKPLENVEVHIEDPDEQGCGEIWVKGPNIMLGYTNPELTAQAIHDGWFRTGDIGRIDAKGELSITGRIKRIIVTEAGKNVYPEEIETLIERYDAIKEAAVLEVNQRPVAVLAVEGSDVRAAREVIANFNKRTSSHNQITRTAVVEDLPKTPLGKVALSVLPEVFEQNVVK